MNKPPFTSLFSFTQKEVDAAFSHASKLASKPGLKLLAAAATEEQIPPHGKLLIMIPRRFGGAVKRNRIRRQIKSIYYENGLYTKPRIAILLVYPDANAMGFEELREFLINALS